MLLLFQSFASYVGSGATALFYIKQCHSYLFYVNNATQNFAQYTLWPCAST